MKARNIIEATDKMDEIFDLLESGKISIEQAKERRSQLTARLSHFKSLIDYNKMQGKRNKKIDFYEFNGK